MYDPPACSLQLFACAGAQNSPPISDPTVGQAFLAISFNTVSNNITYQLFADNITEVMAAHIHISSTVGANGSVSIPLYQAPFVGLPGSTSTGLLAASALMPAVFVGPYLEILPDYTNVNVSAVLTQYVQTGLAYAQVCCSPAWNCMLWFVKSHQTAHVRGLHAVKVPSGFLPYCMAPAIHCVCSFGCVRDCTWCNKLYECRYTPCHTQMVPSRGPSTAPASSQSQSQLYTVQP